jgi:hypothetical protein
MTTAGVRWVVLPASRHAPADPGGPHWARLGGTVVAWSSAGNAGAALGRPGVTPARSAAGLTLVTQVGRSFQDRHPAVPVVLDHGRHLVVDADPDQVDGGGHWRVEPLPVDTVVVDRPDPVPGRSDAATQALLAQLSPEAGLADLTRLVGLGTRHSSSQGFRAAVGFADARLASLGYRTARQQITVGAGQSENLVADRPGAGGDRPGLVLVTAHLDSINLAGGPSAPAPGADDNGSGSVCLLELARVLATRRWRQDLRLLLFGGEEEGLLGSRQYVAALAPADRDRIRAVLNMDMVATRNTVQPTVLLEGAPLSSGQIDDLAAAAATYTGLRVETSLRPFASDHVPFIDAGIPAVLTIEGADSANSAIHTAADTLDRIDLALMREILRANLAALAGWLEPARAVPKPAGPVVARDLGRLDVFVAGVDSHRLRSPRLRECRAAAARGRRRTHRGPSGSIAAALAPLKRISLVGSGVQV